MVSVCFRQCAAEMSGRAEEAAAEGHQEDQHLHRHVCGLLHAVRRNEVSGDLKWESKSNGDGRRSRKRWGIPIKHS